MPRHSKSANTAAFFTSAERQRSTAGTQRQRLGEESQRRADQCNLCLQTLKEPVASPDGYLFCKECILSNLITQKKALAEQLTLYEAEQRVLLAHAEAGASSESAARAAHFRSVEAGSNAVLGRSMAGAGIASLSVRESQAMLAERQRVEALAAVKKERIDQRGQEEKTAEVQKASFWMPEAAKGALKGNVPKPDPFPRDPVGGDFLRAKELIPAAFEYADGAAEHDESDLGSPEASVASGGGGGAGAGGADSAVPSSSATGASGAASKPRPTGTSRYCCPGCLKAIVYQQTFLLRPCGHVLCAGCMKALVIPDKRCVKCGKGPLSKQDLLPLKQGGSSFVAHKGTQAEASAYTPTMLA